MLIALYGSLGRDYLPPGRVPVPQTGCPCGTTLVSDVSVGTLVSIVSIVSVGTLVSDVSIVSVLKKSNRESYFRAVRHP